MNCISWAISRSSKYIFVCERSERLRDLVAPSDALFIQNQSQFWPQISNSYSYTRVSYMQRSVYFRCVVSAAVPVVQGREGFKKSEI